MKIEQTPGCTPTLIDRSTKSAEAERQPSVSTKAAPASSTVFITGQTLLRQRLFLSSPDVEPPMITDKKLMNLLLPLPYYLNTEDRKLLSEIYEFAQSENIDLQFVDTYGMELAHYRSSDNGRHMIPQSRGPIYDMDGHRVTYSFTAADADQATRIRNNASLETTRLDRGFVLYDTDADHSALGHSNFEFLELLVNRFSASEDSMPVNGRFRQYTFTEQNYIVHKSNEVYKLFSSSGAKETDGEAQDAAEQQGAHPATPTLDLSATLRQIIQKYLRESGLPTLFDTLRRLGK